MKGCSWEGLFEFLDFFMDPCGAVCLPARDQQRHPHDDSVEVVGGFELLKESAEFLCWDGVQRSADDAQLVCRGHPRSFGPYVQTDQSSHGGQGNAGPDATFAE